MTELDDLDDDDMLERMEEEHWEFMRLKGGYSEADILRAKKKKILSEDVNVCSIVIKTKAWNFDISCNYTETYLRLAMALEGLSRRQEAIAALQKAHVQSKSRDTRIALALAKLLFKDDQKTYSLSLCTELAAIYHAQNSQQSSRVAVTGTTRDSDDKESNSDIDSDSDSGSDSDSDDDDRGGDSLLMSEDDVSQAYYLAGWTYIHDDNHTAAYRTWSEGHRVAPSCALLARQHRKRECWDQYDPEEDLCQYQEVKEGGDCPERRSPSQSTSLVGSGAYGPGGCGWNKADSFDAYTLLDSHHDGSDSDSGSGNGTSEGSASASASAGDPPAVSLFRPQSQQRQLVFRSRAAVLLPSECRNVLAEVERFHAEQRGGVWSTVRDSSVKTTDVAVEDIPVLRLWLLRLLHSRLFPMIAALFPVLGDGTTITQTRTEIQSEIQTQTHMKTQTDEEATPSVTAAGGRRSRMRVHDAFIVRYDAENEKSFSLPEHCDTSAVSVIVALNSEEDGDYTGGGTWFEALAEKGTVVNAEVGKAVFFAGPLRHAGFPITRGVRNILVLFLYIEDFHYGPLIQRHISCLEEQKQQSKTQNASQSSQSLQSREHKDRDSDRGKDDTVFRNHTVSRKAVVSLKKAKTNERDRHKEDGHEPSAAADDDDDGAPGPQGPRILNSGGEERGYVVYRQTVELVNMLEASSVSLADDE